MAMTSSQVASKPNPLNKQKSRQGIKTLLASLSLATTLGGWAILANERESVSQAISVATPSSRPTQAVIVLDLPPMPTLAPPSALSTELTEQPVPTQPAPQPTLRVVNQPPPQRVVIVGGGGGDSSNSGPQPAAQTRSSR